jgi:hypothetical protein
MNTKVICPNCHSIVTLPLNGNVVDMLVCSNCGQQFMPHFYCPDANFSSRHVVIPTALYVDNEGAAYTFCPEHTFTTYALVTDIKLRPNLRESIAQYLDSLAFRISLEIEDLRLRFSSRQ